MSWLRDHFYGFVLPALKATVGQDNLRADHLRGATLDVQPLPGNGPSELRKLMALCKQLGLTPNGVMALPPGAEEFGLVFQAWRPSEFQPFTGKAPIFSTKAWSWMASDRGKLHFDILRKTLLSVERVRRERGLSRLLLPGRDVWPLKVMATKRDIPATYIPEMSRNVCYHPGALKRLLVEHGVDGSELVVDTGFAGSIVRAMGKVLGRPFQFCLMSQHPRSIKAPGVFVSTAPGVFASTLLGGTDMLPPLLTFPNPPADPRPWPWGDVECVDTDPKKGGHPRMYRSEWGKEAFNANHRPNQVFPNRRKSRTEALETEYLPKYYRQGTVVEGRAVNYLAKPEEIVMTAILTSNIWRGNKGATEKML